MGLAVYKIQLADVKGEVIQAAGGKCYVATAGDAAKATIYNPSTGVAATNPLTLDYGLIEFAVADTVTSVDLYIMAPGGQFVVKKTVKPSGPNEILVDTGSLNQCMVIPFAIGDTTANTETDTGFDVPDDAMMLPHPFVDVLTADVGMTIDVGTMGTSNDPDGFMDGVSIGTVGLAKGTVANAGLTMGALLFVQDSANAGDEAPEGNITAQADNDSISYTLSASTDTGEGFIHLPYLLAA